MGTIDKNIFEKAGAKGCSNSDYNLVFTSCCHSYLVEDEELHNIYYDPNDVSKVIDALNLKQCPICYSDKWDFSEVSEWPRSPNQWQWAYHTNQKIVKNWIKKGRT
jgi:hypothetical protein